MTPMAPHQPLLAITSIGDLKALAGQGERVSPPIRVDQAMIDSFAALTDDHQWIHVDPERAAAESPYGTTIAHGCLILALVPSLFLKRFSFPGRKSAVNYGFDRIRFTSPVRAGSIVRGAFRVETVEDQAEDVARIGFDVEVRIDGESRPALVARWLNQMGF